MYEIFQRLLSEKGITAYRVAKETGIPQSTFTSWKNGVYSPKDEKMKKIADYLGVSVEYLRTGQDQKEKPVETDLKLDNVYLSFAKQAQNEGIPPSDIQLALETIRKLRGEK